MPFSSTTLRVEVDPAWVVLEVVVLALLDLTGSWSATLKMVDTERMIDALEEILKVSLMRSWMVSYLLRNIDQHKLYTEEREGPRT